MQGITHIGTQRYQPGPPNKELQEIHPDQSVFNIHLLIFNIYQDFTTRAPPALRSDREDKEFIVSLQSVILSDNIRNMNTMMTGVDALLATADKDLQPIGGKILAQKRITPEEGILLFEKGSLPFLGALANHVRERPPGRRMGAQPTANAGYRKTL
jgi:hypothetical protein